MHKLSSKQAVLNLGHYFGASENEAPSSVLEVCTDDVEDQDEWKTRARVN